MGKHNRGLTEEDKMGKKKVETAATTTKERAAVSRERRLALALRAVLDELKEGASGVAAESSKAALEVLESLGYGNLVGIPKRIAQLEKELAEAVSGSNYSEVARLGTELERVKAGRFPRAVATINGTGGE